MLRRALPTVAALAALSAAALAYVGGSGQTPARAATGGSLSFQPVLGFPSREVQLIGAAPSEAPGAVWAQAQIGAVPVNAAGKEVANTSVLLRHDGEGAGGWQAVPIANAAGEEISFTPIADRVSAEGAIALLGVNGAGKQNIVTRDPGGVFAEAPLPVASGSEAVLEASQALYPSVATRALLAVTRGIGSRRRADRAKRRRARRAALRRDALDQERISAQSSAVPPARRPAV